MKRILLIVTVLVIAACASHKKNTKTATSSPAPVVDKTVTAASPTSAQTFPIIKPANGIYPPGNEELLAIKAKFADVTLTKLQEGHSLYTQSACIQCHEPLNIYVHDEIQWKSIIGDMAQRARISDEQRDAVYKYVLSIKATQPK